MPMDLKALQKEISFDIRIELLLLPIFILSATPLSAFTIHPQKNFTVSRKLFPVVISSMEDLSDDGGLQKYYPSTGFRGSTHTQYVLGLPFHLEFIRNW